MATTKDDRIYIRVQSEIKDDFEKIAEYRGLKTSTLLHSLIVKLINEEKEIRPQIFEIKNPGADKNTTIFGVESSEKNKTSRIESVNPLASQGPSISFEDAIKDNNRKTKGKK